MCLRTTAAPLSHVPVDSATMGTKTMPWASHCAVWRWASTRRSGSPSCPACNGQSLLPLRRRDGEVKGSGRPARYDHAWARSRTALWHCVRSPPATHLAEWWPWQSRTPSQRGHHVSAVASGMPRRMRSSAVKMAGSILVLPLGKAVKFGLQPQPLRKAWSVTLNPKPLHPKP